MGEIREIRVKVRAFDGAQRSVIGEMHLTLQVGPAEFPILFQVMDVSSNYNLLLGRPWVHMARAVPSTLHQCVKFEWGHREVTIHGEGNHPIYSVNSIPVIDELGGATFHTLEIMQAIRVNEGAEPEDTKLSSAAKMVASEMLKYGYQPKNGLGPKSNGIVESIQLKHQRGTNGLGYDPTFGRFHQEASDTIFVPEQSSIPDQAGVDDIIEGLGNLFVAMAGEEEGINLNKLTIRDAKPGEILQNRTTSPSLFQPESCTHINKNPRSMVMTCNESTKQDENDEQDHEKYDESMMPENLPHEIEQVESQKKPNMDETGIVNLGNEEIMKETRVSIHLEAERKQELIELLKQYVDVFAWSYDDMSGLSTDIVSHKLPIDPTCLPVKQKTRKFKPDLSLRIKEEVTKQIEANIVRASPKDDFPLPNIHILIDNCAKHELQSFVNCFAGYHQILMDKDDAEKTACITPWGVYCYKVMSFGLKNAGATYMKAMTTLFHDMIHKEIEVYVDDVVVKSKKSSDHLNDLRKFFERLHKYNLKLNPAKCAFGVPAGKLLGFIVSRKGIELDPSKIKAIQELPPPKTRKDVMSFLGRLNYISRFIAQSTVTCEPIFKLLKKDAATKWTE
ncbi:uncharacterized protein LOC125873545 [Solanum stenotomum]|uniref:uncharacterized protein LOC125873545 n=1 Tax=Solanum stenotomum TaxID=172797 RepID=UPI0020D07990|nr:uncharacterized protein LOC125873545 [Solanum stenotomum]